LRIKVNRRDWITPVPPNLKEGDGEMIINGHNLNVTMAAFDGCHKIYIPVEGQENLFIQSMEEKGWIFDENFYKIKSRSDMMNMYIDSCGLRFIEQIDCSGNEDVFNTIIPQGAFCDEGFFNEELVRQAFVA